MHFWLLLLLHFHFCCCCISYEINSSSFHYIFGNRQTFFARSLSLCLCVFVALLRAFFSVWFRRCIKYVNMLTTALKCQPAANNDNNKKKSAKFQHMFIIPSCSLFNRDQFFFFLLAFKMHLNATSQNVQ